MHQVWAVDMNRSGRGAIGQRVGAVEDTTSDYLLWHRVLISVVEIHEPGIDGSSPLQKPGGELFPVASRYDPGDPIRRQDAILPRGVIGQRKGSPERTQLLLGPYAPLDQHARSQQLRGLQQGLVRLADHASLFEGFVIVRQFSFHPSLLS